MKTHLNWACEFAAGEPLLVTEAARSPTCVRSMLSAHETRPIDLPPTGPAYGCQVPSGQFERPAGRPS